MARVHASMGSQGLRSTFLGELSLKAWATLLRRMLPCCTILSAYLARFLVRRRGRCWRRRSGSSWWASWGFSSSPCCGSSSFIFQDAPWSTGRTNALVVARVRYRLRQVQTVPRSRERSVLYTIKLETRTNAIG
jgi:hypothetical protein